MATQKVVVEGASVTGPQWKELVRQVVDGELKSFQVQAIIEHRNPFDFLGVEIDWLRVYEVLGLKAEYEAEQANLVSMPDPAYWDAKVVRGVTPNLVVKAFRVLGVKVWTYVDDLDTSVPINDRDPKGSYVVRFQRTVEADPENANQSADDREELGVKDITLLERLLLGLGYFLATEGEHLDVKNATLCSGSRRSDGSVPGVRWGAGSRELYVCACRPAGRDDDLRARAVVSLPDAG